MNLLVFSDIHVCFYTLQQMIDIFNNGIDDKKFDLMLIAGDYDNHGPRNGVPQDYDPMKCAEILNAYADKIVGIRGNCDSEVDQMILKFPMMNESSQLFFESDSGKKMRIFMHHGHLAQYNSENLAKILPASNDSVKTVILSGHTHIPVNEEKNGYHFLNPGSITFPKGGSKKSYATIDTESRRIEIRTL